MRRHAILAQRTVTEGTGSYGKKKSAGGACNRGGVIHSDRLRLRSNPQAVLLFARSVPMEGDDKDMVKHRIKTFFVRDGAAIRPPSLTSMGSVRFHLSQDFNRIEFPILRRDPIRAFSIKSNRMESLSSEGLERLPQHLFMLRSTNRSHSSP